MTSATVQAPSLRWRDRELVLNRPHVMGILNVTPNSFSDGGEWLELGRAVDHAHAMVDAGASIIDVGGESTKPGTSVVDERTELNRVLPVIEKLTAELEVPVSVDTSSPRVMRACINAGVAIVNDVRALNVRDAIEVVAEGDVAVCLMHMQGTPQTMQRAPHYVDVVDEVRNFLERRAYACQDAGIPPDHILIDPGFCFGKTLEHNLLLLRHLPDLLDLGYPVLVGISRKSMIGKVTHTTVDERLAGSVAAAALSAWFGASIVRAHDVRQTVEALALVHALHDVRERKSDE